MMFHMKADHLKPSFPGATERQKEMFGWIMANAFPSVSANDTFALAGVDPTAKSCTG